MTSQPCLLKLAVVAAAMTAIPSVSFTQSGHGKGDLTHIQPATPTAAVDFGVLATGPLRQPEVEHFYLTLRRDLNIGRLQIAMNDLCLPTATVRRRKPARHIPFQL
jgi:hypothetical protein